MSRFLLESLDNGAQRQITAEVIAGRNPDCGLRLPEGGPEGGPSRKHAQLSIAEGALWVEDLGSKNGTFVNDTRVSAKTRLSPGDRLRFDCVEFVVHVAPGDTDASGDPAAPSTRIPLRPATGPRPVTAARPLPRPLRLPGSSTGPKPAAAAPRSLDGTIARLPQVPAGSKPSAAPQTSEDTFKPVRITVPPPAAAAESSERLVKQDTAPQAVAVAAAAQAQPIEPQADITPPPAAHAPEPALHTGPLPLSALPVSALSVPALAEPAVRQITAPPVPVSAARTAAQLAVAGPRTLPMSVHAAVLIEEEVLPGSALRESQMPGAWADPGTGPVDAKTALFSPEKLRELMAQPATGAGNTGKVEEPTLICLSGPERGKRYKLTKVGSRGEKLEWSLGSDPGQDVVLSGAGVSAQHACLVNEGERWTIIDRLSSNGTYVNNRRTNSSFLRSGDTVRLGTVECELGLPSGYAAIQRRPPEAVAAVPRRGRRPRGKRVDPRTLIISFGVTAVILVMVWRFFLS